MNGKNYKIVELDDFAAKVLDILTISLFDRVKSLASGRQISFSCQPL